MEKTIPGIKDIYTVTDDGIVYSYSSGKRKRLRTYINDKGYERCHVYRIDGTRLTTTVHRLVALAYIPNPENKAQVNHKDTNKLNNHYKNLEWATQLENMAHAVENNIYTRYRKVYKYSTDYELVKIYDNVTEAIKDNHELTYNDLSKCLNSTAANTYAKGFYWFDKELTDVPERSKSARKYKPLYMKDMQGSIYGPFDSVNDIMEQYPEFTSKGSVYTCISKHKTYKGYYIYRI